MCWGWSVLKLNDMQFEVLCLSFFATKKDNIKMNCSYVVCWFGSVYAMNVYVDWRYSFCYSQTRFDCQFYATAALPPGKALRCPLNGQDGPKKGCSCFGKKVCCSWQQSKRDFSVAQPVAWSLDRLRWLGYYICLDCMYIVTSVYNTCHYSLCLRRLFQY